MVKLGVAQDPAVRIQPVAGKICLDVSDDTATVVVGI